MKSDAQRKNTKVQKQEEIYSSKVAAYLNFTNVAIPDTIHKQKIQSERTESELAEYQSSKPHQRRIMDQESHIFLDKKDRYCHPPISLIP